MIQSERPNRSLYKKIQWWDRWKTAWQFDFCI